MIMTKEKIKNFLFNKTGYGKILFFGRANTIIWKIGLYLKKNKRINIILPSTLCVSPSVIFSILGFNIEYVDIDLQTGLINENLLIKKIKNKKIDAIFFVNLFGNVSSNKFQSYIIKKDILVIQDLAQTFISSYSKKNKEYVFGDILILSFGYSKIFDLSGGAILLTKDEDISSSLNSLKINNIKFNDSDAKKNDSDAKKEYLNWYNNYFSKTKRIIKSRVKFAKKLYIKKYKNSFDKKILYCLKNLKFEEKKRTQNLEFYKKVFKNNKIRIINNKNFLIPWRFCFLVNKNRDRILKDLRSNKFDASSYYLALNNNTKSVKLEKQIINLWIDKSINKKKILGQYKIVKKYL